MRFEKNEVRLIIMMFAGCHSLTNRSLTFLRLKVHYKHRSIDKRKRLNDIAQ